MIDTFIYWNFRGSKGNANILRISLPCSYNTIKKKILEATNLNLQNSLDVLLYHNNRVLSEYESIQNEMLVEIQRSNIDVVKELLQKSNHAYLERNKSVQDNRRGTTPFSDGRQSEVHDNKGRSTPTVGSAYDSGGIGGSHRGAGTHEGKPSSPELNRAPKMSRTANYPYSSKQPWNVYNRNAVSTKENNEDDEDMKIQEVMEKNNPYNQRPDFSKSRMLNYYKRDKNSVSQFYMNNKFKKVPSPSSASASSISKNLNAYNSVSSAPRGGEQHFQNGVVGTYSKYYKMRGAPQNSGYGSAMSHSTYTNSRGQQKEKNGYSNMSNQDTSTKYVSPDYICHMCGKKGHSIKNCPMSSFNNNKKIKVPTGIPTNFLTKIKAEDINKYDQIYILKDGSYGVMKDVEDVSGSAYLYRSVDDKINIYLGVNSNDNRNVDMDGDRGGDGRGNPSANPNGNLSSSTHHTGTSSYPNEEEDKISNLYKCLLCKKLYISPTTLPCCGETYCKSCLYRYNRKRKNDYSSSQMSSLGYQQNGDGRSQMMKCPNCQKLINSDTLIINTNIKNVIDTIIRNQKDSNTNKDEEHAGGGKCNKGEGDSHGYYPTNGGASVGVDKQNKWPAVTPSGGVALPISAGASNGAATTMSNVGMSHISSDKNTRSYNRATNGVTNNSESSSSVCASNGASYQRQPFPSGNFPAGSDLPSNNSRTTEEQNSVNSSSLCNENEDEFQDKSFNPLINLPINLQEIKRQHDFAGAYIAKYRMRRKPKRKKNVDLGMLLMSKRRVY
ncbi:hypothetical protein, conserved in Apicomplexan species [Plasmodium knowlesi strain H]|uniref:Zinc finger protein n=3 Tax=Plasmodium knowlesi TaxID=5850 RepID=A0A5E7X6R6_PLAKH|nr:zinc finger protein, putative [Plasmodium knowlesi strain H]OTN67826.1 Uncharacterized protein PKNOH_S05387800 [Plasmodium knowlesi]CAA9990465.1 zinc finger protein, putative [Plasmodium knowlesi strain H]SBO19673.1 hypothetical protein, conserved in Apicomplexan species [Plasmodium knowlesi strain H]SBO22498.1 hypothetical protein, conserved in Apicomplexan species [Plasmodium knowlesi strain H]VVS79939.1 zinc finger protein, putative [Plasmodium knowlesi strain H]